MSFDFFDNSIKTEMNKTPKDYYKELQQAFISDQWDNTSSLYKIQEQLMENNEFPKFAFEETEAWIDYVVGQTSSGFKNGDDFCQLTFECLDHPCVRGRYYYFDNNYWIAYFTDEYNSLVKSLAVRRCNNFMRIIDPESNKIFSVPCVVDYDISSPMNQISRYIITPNSHATIMVQGNPDTLRLFKINTRYILGGRPFKLYAYQNTLNDDVCSPTPTLLYLDLYLDEVHALDDIETQVADNGQYVYQIDINSENLELFNGSKGQFDAKVLLNGEETDRDIKWSTNNSKVVKIDSDGNYEIVGDVGQEATVTVKLMSNPLIFDSINIAVGNNANSEPKIILTPTFESIREYETITTDISVSYQGVIYTDSLTTRISLDENKLVLKNSNLSIVKNGNSYSITCDKRTSVPVVLYISASNTTPIFNATESFEIKLRSMMG